MIKIFFNPNISCLQKSWQCYQQNVAFLKMAVEIAKREKLSWRIEKVRLKSHGSKSKKHQEDFVTDFLYIWPSLGFEAINIFESLSFFHYYKVNNIVLILIIVETAALSVWLSVSTFKTLKSNIFESEKYDFVKQFFVYKCWY